MENNVDHREGQDRVPVNGGDRGIHGGAWLDDGAERRLDQAGGTTLH
jgi:hypothetical protein